ncbi:SidA/IucD/PvdA family monooxygenase [Streptomyces griseofuscus]|uniref:SidA/IucD/PvdA family monooxygenase n=1 Tax=Streptomyces griseofuscus TaxID=146922 RepID=UPI0036C2C19A
MGPSAGTFVELFQNSVSRMRVQGRKSLEDGKLGSLSNALTPGRRTGPPRSAPYDIVGMNFGPSDLALAIAVREMVPLITPQLTEHCSEFRWWPGAVLEEARMQISFQKEPVSPRNLASPATDDFAGRVLYGGETVAVQSVTTAGRTDSDRAARPLFEMRLLGPHGGMRGVLARDAVEAPSGALRVPANSRGKGVLFGHLNGAEVYALLLKRSAGSAVMGHRSSAAPSWLVAQFPAPLQDPGESHRTSPDPLRHRQSHLMEGQAV